MKRNFLIDGLGTLFAVLSFSDGEEGDRDQPVLAGNYGRRCS